VANVEPQDSAVFRVELPHVIAALVLVFILLFLLRWLRD
jgi:hypothetical protein